MRIVIDNDLTSFIESLEKYKREFGNREKNENFLWEQIKVYFNDILNLFWGTRINPDIYSLDMLDWFYNMLQEKDKVNPLDVCNILEKVIEHEMAIYEGEDTYYRC